jgi:hypothetical protein
MGGGGAGRDKLVSRDVGRLPGGKSLSIRHFQGLQVVMRHEGELGYQGHVGLGKEAFLA